MESQPTLTPCALNTVRFFVLKRQRVVLYGATSLGLTPSSPPMHTDRISDLSALVSVCQELIPGHNINEERMLSPDHVKRQSILHDKHCEPHKPCLMRSVLHIVRQEHCVYIADPTAGTPSLLLTRIKYRYEVRGSRILSTSILKDHV